MHVAAGRAWGRREAVSFSSLPNLSGVVGILTQVNGTLSRVLNSSVGTTPVTSEFLTEAAAPGQITQRHVSFVCFFFLFSTIFLLPRTDFFFLFLFSFFISSRTTSQITQSRKMLNLPTREDAKHFHLFGTPISKSPSPTMHNTAFKLLGNLGFGRLLFLNDDTNYWCLHY
jgi:hypothetical protein